MQHGDVAARTVVECFVILVPLSIRPKQCSHERVSDIYPLDTTLGYSPLLTVCCNVSILRL